jgi:hypothetical protein
MFMNALHNGGVVMNLVFFNSLEKKVGEDRVITAQVSISENQGEWHVRWNEPRNGKMEQESWFDGRDWEEMLKAFRYRLSEKSIEGFVPILAPSAEDLNFSSDRAKMVKILQYYSELNGKEDLYQQLRQWRREQCIKEGKPPFIIASNRVLRMISAFLPKTKDELLQIPGFGETKSRLYGQEILRLTEPHERSKDFPLEWVAAEVNEQSLNIWMHQQKQLKVKSEFDRQALKRKVLEGFLQGISLADMQQQTNIPRRDLVQWIERLDNEGYDLDRWIEAELESIPLAERQLAWKAFEEEGERYLKPILKKIGLDEKDKNVDQVYEWLRLLRVRFRKDKGTAHQAS